MSVTKRILGDYSITNKDSSGNVTISTHTLFVDGNLFVGNITTANVTNADVTDATITLNKGETGAGITIGYAGIEVDRGSEPDVGIRYNESIDNWELTTDGTTWANVTSGSSSAIANIYQDPAPRISANLEITDKTIFDTIANVEIRANTSAMGGTGVYTNPIGAVDQKKELITKNRALVYSIILQDKK